MADHNLLGQEGEQIAQDFLIKKGYTIVETNYRYLKTEIDLIVQRHNILICVEVKTRSTPIFGDPQDFVKPKQIERLVKAMNTYVIAHDLDVEVRFDIVAIIKNKSEVSIEHLENAFYHF